MSQDEQDACYLGKGVQGTTTLSNLKLHPEIMDWILIWIHQSVLAWLDNCIEPYLSVAGGWVSSVSWNSNLTKMGSGLFMLYHTLFLVTKIDKQTRQCHERKTTRLLFKIQWPPTNLSSHLWMSRCQTTSFTSRSSLHHLPSVNKPGRSVTLSEL